MIIGTPFARFYLQKMVPARLRARWFVEVPRGAFLARRAAERYGLPA
jgi:hypothetical protein